MKQPSYLVSLTLFAWLAPLHAQSTQASGELDLKMWCWNCELRNDVQDDRLDPKNTMKTLNVSALLATSLAFAFAACGAAFSKETSTKTHTWDNDPNGVQVFILAGQSNMVGHGKADDGHGDVKGAIGSLRYQVEHDPKKYPAFIGNVKTTDARPFWRDASVSPSNFGYHWNHNGESQYLNGKAMAEKMAEMIIHNP